MSLTEKEVVARGRVCLALDVAGEAIRMAEHLSHYVGLFKVNSVFTDAGIRGLPIVSELFERSENDKPNVFLDCKFHDTPETVFNYGRESAVPGVYMFNLHVAGGEMMCRKAVEGAYKGAESRNVARPKVIGVTVLTSLDDSDLLAQGLNVSVRDLTRRRTELARKWGLDGIVCPANIAGDLEKEFGPWLYVTPGIKYDGVQNDGQKQLDTPDGAVQTCKSSILVIGTAITGKKDKPKSYEQMRESASGILKAMSPYV